MGDMGTVYVTSSASARVDHAAERGSPVAVCGTEVVRPTVIAGRVTSREFDPDSVRACRRCAAKVRTVTHA